VHPGVYKEKAQHGKYDEDEKKSTAHVRLILVSQAIKNEQMLSNYFVAEAVKLLEILLD